MDNVLLTGVSRELIHTERDGTLCVHPAEDLKEAETKAQSRTAKTY